MVKGIQQIADNIHPGTPAVKHILLTKKNTHCHLCTGFGHPLKDCPSYKQVKQAVRRCKILKGGWKAIYSHLYDLGKLDQAGTIQHQATQASYGGSTKGRIYELTIGAMTDGERSMLRIILGPEPPVVVAP